MNIKKALENYLKNYAELKEIHNEQVCCGIAPAGWKAPYQSIFKVSDPRGSMRLGSFAPRFQINNFSLSQSQADLMAELTRKALDGFVGEMGGTEELQGVKIIIGLYQDSTEIYEPETGLYNCPVDVKIQYRG